MTTKIPFLKPTTAALLLALSATGSLAQSENASATEASNQENKPTAKAEASKDELRVSPEDAQKEVTDVNKASKIIGMPVHNKQNERVGKVKDIVIDTKSGKVAYAVISAGGVLGTGDKLIAVPIESLTPQQGAKGFLINAEKDRLSQASGFSDKDWPRIDAGADSNTIGLTPTGRSSAEFNQRPSSTSASQPSEKPSDEQASSAASASSQSSASSEPSSASTTSSTDNPSTSSTNDPAASSSQTTPKQEP